MTENIIESLNRDVNYLKLKLGETKPLVGIVPGSGFSGVLDRFERLQSMPIEDLESLTGSTVRGHGQELILHGPAERSLLRIPRHHRYEGAKKVELIAPGYFAKNLGAKALVLTGAVGSLYGGFHPGSLVVIEDHISFTMGESALYGEHYPELGPRFPDMVDTYHSGLRELFQKAAKQLHVDVYSGVLTTLRGPQYETPAEVNALKALGAHVVGMSTVTEAIPAKSIGIPILAVCQVTNWAGARGVDHGDVLELVKEREETTHKVFARFFELLADAEIE